jgi:hypothetical protein
MIIYTRNYINYYMHHVHGWDRSRRPIVLLPTRRNVLRMLRDIGAAIILWIRSEIT